MTEKDEMRNTYRELTADDKEQMSQIKDQGAKLFSLIESLGSKREYSLAKTKVEEAVMWAVKGITG